MHTTTDRNILSLYNKVKEFIETQSDNNKVYNEYHFGGYFIVVVKKLDLTIRNVSVYYNQKIIMVLSSDDVSYSYIDETCVSFSTEATEIHVELTKYDKEDFNEDVMFQLRTIYNISYDFIPEIVKVDSVYGLKHILIYF